MQSFYVTILVVHAWQMHQIQIASKGLEHSTYAMVKKNVLEWEMN